jgi:transcriptional regulator with XRE-family HTH domain
MESIAVRFGRRVKELRVAKRLTQEQLGQKCGVDYKYLGEIERGVKAASFGTIEKLAHGLNVDYYELFLPSARMTASVQKDIDEMLADAKRVDGTKIEGFLRGLRSLLRELDRPARRS